MPECQRCGLCCQTVGRTFWKGGNFDDYPGLQAVANNGDYEDGGLPCEMLRFIDGKAVCLIELNYSYDVKPKGCRGYPELGPCFREQAEAEPIVNNESMSQLISKV